MIACSLVITCGAQGGLRFIVVHEGDLVIACCTQGRPCDRLWCTGEALRLLVVHKRGLVIACGAQGRRCDCLRRTRESSCSTGNHKACLARHK